MAQALHVLKGAHHDAAALAIARERAAGTAVAVALLYGVAPPALPADVRVVRVPEELDHAALLELVFSADTVTTW